MEYLKVNYILCFTSAYLVDLNGPKEMERDTPWDFQFESKDPDVLRAEEESANSDDDSSECGFHLLGEVPSDEEEDNRIEFEFSDLPPIQSYNFTVDESRGLVLLVIYWCSLSSASRSLYYYIISSLCSTDVVYLPYRPENFMLLSEVLFRLNMSDSRLCSVHGALEIEHITWDEFTAKLEHSQIPLVPPEDLRPLRGVEMMDFVKLDRKLIEVLGSDMETLVVGEDRVGAGESRNVTCDKGNQARLLGLPVGEDTPPPLGSYISRTGSGDKSIRRGVPSSGVPREAITPGECFSSYTSPTITSHKSTSKKSREKLSKKEQH